MKNIYQALIEESVLCAEDRNELQTRRGLNDSTIDALKFRSGRKEIIEPIVSNWRKKKIFSEKKLIKCGVLYMNDTDDTASISSQLISNKILIPYLDQEGKVFHLRPHKGGLKGIPTQIYCPFLLNKNERLCLVTEGEFKAAAAWQMGFSVLSIPGVQSYAGDKFSELIDLLHRFSINQAVIVFDNDDSDIVL